MLALTLATVIFALILLAKGFALTIGKQKFLDFAHKFLYNRAAAIIIWSIAVGWTLLETNNLGPSDFGSFKVLLFVIFTALGVASVWMLRDYLVVRGIAVIALYCSWWFLKAAFLQPEWTRLFLVAPTYLTIIAALWLALAPWRVRDFVDWLGKKANCKLVGWGHLIYGVLLLIVAATYKFFV